MKLGDFPSNIVYCPSGVSLARHSSSCRPLFFLRVVTLPRILLPAHILHRAPLLSTLEKRIAHLLETQLYSVFRNWRFETRPYRASSWCSQRTRMSQSLPCSPRYVSLCYLIAWLLSFPLPWYSGVPSTLPFSSRRSLSLPFVRSRAIPELLVHVYVNFFHDPIPLPALALPPYLAFSAFLPPLLLTDDSSSSTSISTLKMLNDQTSSRASVSLRSTPLLSKGVPPFLPDHLQMERATCVLTNP